MKRSVLSGKKGVALLMALGMLAIMSILGVSFATSMRLGEKGSKVFLRNMQAKYMAEGGIARAIADLKYNSAQGAMSTFIDSRNEDFFTAPSKGLKGFEGWYSVDQNTRKSGVIGIDIENVIYPSYRDFYRGIWVSVIEWDAVTSRGVNYTTLSGNIIGEIRLKVIDTGSQININDSNNPDLKTILENLVGILGTPLVAGDGNNIYNNKPYGTKREIQKVSGIDLAKYNKIKDYITVFSYEDPNNPEDEDKARAAININTASKPVLHAIFYEILNNNTKAANLADAIADPPPSRLFNSWADFNSFMKGLPAGLTADEADKVMTWVNPNRTDKLHTKFIFNSGGIYEIECLAGIWTDRAAAGILAVDKDVMLAQKKIKTTVQVFNMWNQTTKGQFQGDVDIDGDGTLDTADGDIDINSDGDVSDIPVYTCITWKNSCPVNYDNCLKTHVYDPNNAETIAGALKMGFWDDFDEDYSTDGTGIGYNEVQGVWKNIDGDNKTIFKINKDGSGKLRTWPTGDFVLHRDYFPKVELDGSKYKFDDFSIRVRIIDEISGSKSGMRQDLPWPAVPKSSWWEGAAPAWVVPVPCYAPCSPKGVPPYNCHERWMNVGHLQFGKFTGTNPSAIYCSFPQTDDIYTEPESEGGPVDNQIYDAWVNYDGTGYIYFAPKPDIKPYSVLSQPHVMVACNEWEWGVGQPWYHSPAAGTITFGMPAYKSDKTFQFRSKGERDLKGTVYYSGGSTSIDTGNEPLMEWTDRLIRIEGMGNLFDAKNIRIINEDGSYESLAVDQTLPELDLPTSYEWGTIFTTVTIPSTANGNNEKVILRTSNAGEGTWSDIGTSADTGAGPGGCSVTGPINETDSTSIQYKIDFTTSDTDLLETPVLEDIWITYLPRTRVLYRREN